MRALPSLSACALVVLFVACGSSSDDGPGGGGAGAVGGGMPTGEAGYRRCAPLGIGEFSVVIEPTHSDLNGTVYDGVLPSRVPEQAKTAGECRLMKARVLQCSPACTGEETCGTAGKCIAQPKRKSVGKVTIDGLATAVSLMPSDANVYIYSGSLTHPAVQPGGEVRLAAAGGDFEPFMLKASGIAPLEVPDQTAVLESGKSARIVWPAPAQAQGRVHLRLDVNHHGSTSNWIECDVPDTGSYDIPASLVTDLLGFGVSGYPTVIVSRRSSDATAIRPGCVELRVVSEDEVEIQVKGLVSCKEDMDCPTGKKCGLDQACK